MRKKTTATFVIGLIITLTLPFIAIAATDAPHNASNNISCGSCHGETIVMNSPFWGGTGTYDQLCLSCHRRSTGGPYSQTDAPAVTTHSDSSESALAECRDCHNPHYQRQKVYKNTDASNLYLATGKILSCEYSDKDPLTKKDISTFHYSDNPLITYKSGTGWDATKLPKKTENYRGAILFPHVNKLGYNYPITAVNPTARTITVNGNLTTECNNNLFSSATFAVMYGQYIKDNIVVDSTNKQVKFFDQTGAKSFADGDTTYNGVCEVCHIHTTYHKNDGSGTSHYPTNNCSTCHSHTDGFAHGGGGGAGCDSCHGHDNGWGGGEYSGTTISHSTHTENEADDYKVVPSKDCEDCHDIDMYPYFQTGIDNNGDGKYNLAETDLCDNCHSPDGSFNGVISQGASIGAKTNWKTGVYETDYTLTVGKEKWCAGCHDNGNTAPDIVGDNNTYGYYLVAHGDGTDGVNRQEMANAGYSQGECVHCHDVSKTKATYLVPATRIINETFERNPGYDENGLWIETVNGGSLNEDSAPPACNPPACTPPINAGLQCLKSVSSSSTYQVYATRDLGSVKNKTFTRFYLYVEAEGLSNNDNKEIVNLMYDATKYVILFRLNQNSGQLRLNFQLYYNNGTNFIDDNFNISTGRWYRVEVKYDTTNPGAADAWKWQVDGVSQGNGALTSLVTYYSGIKRWLSGFQNSAQQETGTIYFDNFAVDNSDWVGEDPSEEYLHHGGQLFYNPLVEIQGPSVGGLCLKCHTGPGDSLQTSMPNQYSYSKLHGGSTVTCPDNIKQAFAGEGYIHIFSNPTDWTLGGCTIYPSGYLLCMANPPDKYADNSNAKLQTAADFVLKVTTHDFNIAQTEGPEIRVFLQGDGNSINFDIYSSSIRIRYGGTDRATTAITRQADTYLRVSRVGTTYYFQAFSNPQYTNQITNEISWDYGTSSTVDKIRLLTSGCTNSIYYDDFLFFHFYPEPPCDPNQGWFSSHYLLDVRDSLKGKWGWGDLAEYIDPCSGCHNPHRATRDYPASLSDGHANPSTWEVWGDDTGEKMADYVSGLGLIYQPPYKAGGGYERDADTQPDYNTLCLKCHSSSQTSTLHGIVNAVNWNTSMHGKGVAYVYGGFAFGDLKPPYDEANRGKYVLCCTDCHEPHGSTNSFLLRKTVNGVSALPAGDGTSEAGGYWYYWCSACHVNKHAGPTSRCGDAMGCHLNNKDHSYSF